MSNDEHHSRKAICTASILWFFWALSTLPLLVLITEFGRLDLGACGNEGWYYARLHSHVFLYPITFGLVSTVFLTKPWIRSVNYLRDLCLSSDQKERKIGIWSVALIIGTILLVTGISGSFSSSPAVWSFTPRSLTEFEGWDEFEKQCEQNKNGHKNREKIIEYTPRKITEEIIDYTPGKTTGKIIEKIIEHPLEKDTDKVTETTTETSKSLLDPEWKKSHAPLSHTEVVYRIGHLAMTILFCLLFTTGSLFAALPSEMGRGKEKGSGAEESEKKVLERHVWIALFFASFWMLMRATFLFEEQPLYGENQLLDVHRAFLLLFVGLFVLLPALYRYRIYKNKSDSPGNPQSAEQDSQGSIILIVIGLVEGVIAGLELTNVSSQIGKVLIFVFGTGSSILSYFAMFTVILVFSIPFILQRLRKESSKVDKNTGGWFKRKFPYRGS